jgi:hypothetical protein
MKNTVRRSVLIILVLLVPTWIAAWAQEEVLSQGQKEDLVAKLCERIEKTYVFTENTEKLCGLLKANLTGERYRGASSAREFAALLDQDIEAATHDQHFGITYDPKQAKEMAAEAGKSASFYTPQLVEEYRRMNYGFKEVKILEGNVGYLDLRDFFPLRWSAEPAVAAMGYLANCDAVIVDLRWNGGGEDTTVTFLLSYFIDSRDSTTTFSTRYSRFNDSYYSASTWPYVPGKGLYTKPLYVLISKSSFSGAEAFAFHLQTLKRATLIGERTRGGANPVEIQEIDGKYVVYIPSEKLVSSLAGGDWEGVGVKPDIEADAAGALAVAHEEALKGLAAKAADDGQRSYFRWTLESVQAGNRPAVIVAADLLRSYAGKYNGDWTISLEKDGLFFQRGARAKLRMVPMAQDLFLVENMDQVRLRFVKEADGSFRLDAQHEDGRVIPHPKDNHSQVNKR